MKKKSRWEGAYSLHHSGRVPGAGYSQLTSTTGSHDSSNNQREREGAGERAAHPVQPQCVFDFSVETHRHTPGVAERKTATAQDNKGKRARQAEW